MALGEKGSLQTVMEPHLGRLVTAESSGEPPGDRANSTHSDASGFPHPAARSPKTDKQQTQEPTYFLYLPHPVGPAFHEDALS